MSRFLVVHCDAFVDYDERKLCGREQALVTVSTTQIIRGDQGDDILKQSGWTRRNGLDYCPICSAAGRFDP